MKTISFKTLALSVAGLTLAAFGASANAASTWNFSTCNSNTANNSTGTTAAYGNTWTCAGSVAGNSVAVTGWGGADATGSTGFQTAYVSPQGGSGFGLASRYETLAVGQPDHALDNNPNNATPDMILLHFNTAVALGTITTGYVSGDSDITLMAFGAGTPTILGKNETNITSGWSLVETSVGDGTAGSRSVNAGSVVASWWLISAYSSAISGGTLTEANDYFKLLSVGSKDLQVPEPGSLALLGAGLLGLVASRRRKQAAAA